MFDSATSVARVWSPPMLTGITHPSGVVSKTILAWPLTEYQQRSELGHNVRSTIIAFDCETDWKRDIRHGHCNSVSKTLLSRSAWRFCGFPAWICPFVAVLTLLIGWTADCIPVENEVPLVFHVIESVPRTSVEIVDAVHAWNSACKTDPLGGRVGTHPGFDLAVGSWVGETDWSPTCPARTTKYRPASESADI